MDVLDGSALPADWNSLSAPICVILRSASTGRLAETAQWLQADGSLAEQWSLSPQRRPAGYVDGGRISLLGFATDERGVPTEVHLHVGGGGLLVLCPDAVAGLVRQAVGPGRCARPRSDARGSSVRTTTSPGPSGDPVDPVGYRRRGVEADLLNPVRPYSVRSATSASQPRFSSKSRLRDRRSGADE